MDLISKLFITLLVYSFLSVILYITNQYFRTKEGILFVHIPLLFLIIALFMTFPEKSLIHLTANGTHLRYYPEFTLSYIRLGLFTCLWLSCIFILFYPLKFKFEYGFCHWIFLSVIIFSASVVTFVYGTLLFLLSFMPYAVSKYQNVHNSFASRTDFVKEKLKNAERVVKPDRGEVLILFLYIVALISMLIIQILQVF